MIALLQRVHRAGVSIEGIERARIGPGLLIFLGVERNDTAMQAERLLERVLTYRVFADAQGRMNRNVQDCGGGLLVVPQFTLAADTRSGTRPGFSTAASPEDGRRLFEYFLAAAVQGHAPVQSGVFGADMQVELVNDGPVTFWLQVAAPR